MDKYDIIAFVIIVGFVFFGGVLITTITNTKSVGTVIESCEKTGMFFVGDKVFDCKLRMPK